MYLNLLHTRCLKQRLSLLEKKVEAMPKSAWTEKDQIDNFLKERSLMRSLEKLVGGRFYKVIRHRYSNPKIQPEPEGSTQGYLLDSVEVLRFYTLAGNPVKEILLKLNLPDHRSILTDSKEYIKMDTETSATLIPYVFLEVTNIKVKEFQRSFCHSDTERLSRSDEVLKLNNFKKDAALKLFKMTNQERCEHVFKITFLHTSQDKGTSSSLKSMITTSIHKSMIEVKDYELKTKVKA
ncbi:hypothetical protein Tco_1016682 [Tanacetum coccineum]|uniref:Uncharacterized protein n=1 Tax=Tanacetum coccineum TaxID=301880 RepID=A0ABQ5FRA7_9ASTR